MPGGGALRSVPDANIGSIFGIGFPANGGERSSSPTGTWAGCVARSRELAAAYGERFEPPALSVETAQAGDQLT